MHEVQFAWIKMVIYYKMDSWEHTSAFLAGDCASVMTFWSNVLKTEVLLHTQIHFGVEEYNLQMALFRMLNPLFYYNYRQTTFHSNDMFNLIEWWQLSLSGMAQCFYVPSLKLWNSLFDALR